MSKHLAVQFLTAALARAEENAEAATPGPWGVRPPSDHGDGWEVCGRGPGHNESRWVVGAESGGGVYDEADARHIALHDPAAVLRRVAAEQQILAMWEDPGLVRRLPEGVHDGRDPDEVEADVAAAEAIDRVVLLLAEGYGWVAS